MPTKTNPPEARAAVSESQPDPQPISSKSRRKFLGRVGGATAAAWTTGFLGLSPLLKKDAQAAVNQVNRVRGENGTGKGRQEQVYNLRVKLAQEQMDRPLPDQITNGDEKHYSTTFIGNYSKALPHTAIGDPDPSTYGQFLNACKTGRQSDWESLSLGGIVPLTSPQGGLTYSLEGADPIAMTLPPAPAFASAQRAGEMVENYWQAVCRDVSFSDYGNEPLTQAAIADLNKLSDFRGPKVNGKVTASTLFRGFTPSDVVGPYVSQFLVQPVNGLGNFLVQNTSGAVDQIYKRYSAGLDYMTDTPSWLAVQNGQATDASKARTIFFAFGPNSYQDPGRLANGRDLAGMVHTDELYQHPFWAACQMLGNGFPPNPGNPYSATKTPNEIGFASWGGPMFTGLIGQSSLQGILAVWFYKFYVQHNLRPEEFSGRVHNQLTGANSYPINSEVLNSAALQQVFSKYGSYYLPMAYPEGCPTHPSYGSGHATVAAAGCTLLKALFNPDTTFVSMGITPMYSPDGVTLQPYTGSDVDKITVGTELDKLASNVGLGRNIAGVHWRSDYQESLNLGEKVAVTILQDLVQCFNEVGGNFQFTRFDGTKIKIARQ